MARPAGFEPTVFRVGVENVIHCTTAAGNPYIIAQGPKKGKRNICEDGNFHECAAGRGDSATFDCHRGKIHHFSVDKGEVFGYPIMVDCIPGGMAA
jgi:hypothetical protein